MRELLFATTNPGKRSELEAMLPGARIRTLLDFPAVPVPEETGETFVENAELKATAYARATGLAAIADDSGLSVESLGGRPGVHSARYADGDDGARIRKLLGELERVPPGQRDAAFRCALCLALPSGETFVEEGACRGQIALAPRGTNGFGYDPIFLFSDGRTMAELSREEKSAISHRGRAFQRIRPLLLAKLSQ